MAPGTLDVRRLASTLALIVLIDLIGVAAAFAGTATFGYRKLVTIDSARVMGAVNHQEFPVLVSLTDLDLRTTANGGHVESAQGYDIVFTASDGVSRLDFEIESYDGATGALAAWVKVPLLQVASDTLIYITYGSTDVFTPQETTTETWNTGYLGVWHLHEEALGNPSELQDSSRFSNHGIAGNGSQAHSPERTTGRVGFGQYFDRVYAKGNATIGAGATTVTFASCSACLPANIQGGDTLVLDPGGGNEETFTVVSRLSATQVSVSAPAASNHAAETYVLFEDDANHDMINVGDDPSLDVTGDQITLQAWIQHDITPDFGDVFGILNHKGFNAGYRLVMPENGRRLQFDLPGSTHSLTSAGSLPNNVWHHVAATYDGATMRLYVNGVADANTLAKAGNIPSDAPTENDVWLGHGDQPVDKPWSYPWEGLLDEMRISSVARSGGWIATEFENQSSPGTFYAVSPEQPGAFDLATLDVNLRSIGTGGQIFAAGQASVALSSTTVTFTGTLPDNVGAGDRLILDPSGLNEETLFIATRDSSTQVTLQTRTAQSHVGESFSIERAYGGLQSWEDDRQGDLVAENRREMGVVYDDGELTTSLIIDGSTTDSARYLALTVAVGHRHSGVAGTGATLRPATGSAIYVEDDYTRVEWLEITGWPSAHGVLINADHTQFRNLIVHDGGDAFSDGFQLQENQGDWTASVENTITYNMGRACYNVDNVSGSTRSLFLKLENVTAFNCGSGGGAGAGGVVVCEAVGNESRLYARNVLSVGNNVADFNAVVSGGCDGTPSWTISDANVSSDATAPGPASTTMAAAVDQFVSITPTAEDLHLKAGADAIDAGQIARKLLVDIDGELRPQGEGTWDVGADETDGTPHVPTNYRSIGTALDVSGTLDATQGSAVVTDAAATWQSANRGRGDRIAIGGTDYTVLTVSSETELTLTTAYTGTTGPHAYTISRQYATLQAWEDCISFETPASCSYFQVASADLVADSRREIGIAYDDVVGTDFTDNLVISGATTDANYHIVLTAVGDNRHFGIADGGVALDPAAAGHAITVESDYTVVEWLEIRNWTGMSSEAVRINAHDTLYNYILAHDAVSDDSDGFYLQPASGDYTATIRNSIVYNVARAGIHLQNHTGGNTLTLDLENVTVYNCGTGISTISFHAGGVSACENLANESILNATNVLSVGNVDQGGDGSADFNQGTGGGCDGGASWGVSDFNFASDNFAPGTTVWTSQPVDQFASTVPGFEDLHLDTGAEAIDKGVDLSSRFVLDIDFGVRQVGPWDIGADEFGAATAVELASFEATGHDGEVSLTWATASELNNLGFHVYRAPSHGGPYERVTKRPIPGLGSSPIGARYRYRNEGLTNGVTYYYKLEDIETTGATKLHGPVSATPEAGIISYAELRPADGGDLNAGLTYGEPEANALRIVPRRDGVVLELETRGFVAVAQEDGTVRLEVPGLEEFPGSSLPVKRAWVEAVAGRDVKLLSVRARDVARFVGLQPGASLVPDVEATARGTVRARRVRRGRRSLRREAAKLLEAAYQGETKKALVELSPFTWEGNGLVVATKLEVHIAFRGREPSRRRGRTAKGSQGLRLATVEPGLYGISLDELFGRRLSRRTPSFRLSRQDEDVAYHVEDGLMYFWSDGAAANPYGTEAVYEVELGVSGKAMDVAHDATGRSDFYWHEVEREENRYYQAALVDAPDVWLWELLFAPERKSFELDVTELAGVSEPSMLEVWLQGASDFPQVDDHHVRVYVNGSFAAETRWNGKQAQRVEAELGGGVLVEGRNVVELENVGDTGAAYSMVMLDRFRVRYPRAVSVLERASYVLDVSDRFPRWVAAGSGFDAERDYIAVAAVLRPELRKAPSTRLNRPHRADYLVIGPEAFLETAKPLLGRRRRQGLRVATASTEAIASEFGHGELRPEAIRELIAYAYHEWRAPKLRYVLLLGDGSFDFKDVLGTGVGNQLPPLVIKTSYLWTASDPAYASVNGDDVLPDVAIGRLPAKTTAELRVMVEKILAYERAKPSSKGPFVLVADDADAAGGFEADAEEIASTTLAGRETRSVHLSQLGASATRSAVVESLDAGASTLSYLGHGGIHLWADENVFNTGDVAALGSQSHQPMVFTMNCLNGYFHFPYFDSLAEALVKAEGRGAIAAFSPSGMSLNAPAHRYHQALLEELLDGGHGRLGDAILAAQKRYADTHAFPELLAIYHLFGDPALRLK